MGSLHAIEFASAVEEGSVSLDAALTYHLRSNHFPPVPLAMIEPCKAAIADPDGEVDLPEGVEYRDGRTTVPAHLLITSLHLEAFLEED